MFVLRKCYLKVIIFITLFTFVATIIANVSYASYEVKLIYFQCKDAEDVDKTLYQDIMLAAQKTYHREMLEDGYDKTFNIASEIHVIEAKHNSNQYVSDTWNKVSDELPSEFKNTNNIHVIVISVLSELENGIWGLGWPVLNAGEYGGYVIAVENSPFHVRQIIEHELGHCFGLYHNIQDGDYIMGTGLAEFHEYETRWMSKHHYFNKERKFNATPSITKIYTNKLLEDNKVQLKFNVESVYGLHQAQVFRSSDLGIIGWQYLLGDSDIIDISVDKIKLFNEDTYVLMIMDENGNYNFNDYTYQLEQPQTNKNPPLAVVSEIPDVVYEDTSEYIVYLTILNGDTPLPNQDGLNPHNDEYEYKNGWGHQNISDNATTHKKVISIRGSSFERGISLTPPDHPSESILKYDLTGNDYVKFVGYIGMTDDHQHAINTGSNEGAEKSCFVGGTVQFEIKLDGISVYTSDILSGLDEALLLENRCIK